MKKTYLKSLQMIKILKIKDEKDYNRLLNYYILLNIESLKYMAKTRDFSQIVKIANSY